MEDDFIYDFHMIECNVGDTVAVIIDNKPIKASIISFEQFDDYKSVEFYSYEFETDDKHKIIDNPLFFKDTNKKDNFGGNADGITVGYMCLIDYQCELGVADGGNVVYPSYNNLKQKHGISCGVAEVCVSLKSIITDGFEELYGDENEVIITKNSEDSYVANINSFEFGWNKDIFELFKERYLQPKYIVKQIADNHYIVRGDRNL